MNNYKPFETILHEFKQVQRSYSVVNPLAESFNNFVYEWMDNDEISLSEEDVEVMIAANDIMDKLATKLSLNGQQLGAKAIRLQTQN